MVIHKQRVGIEGLLISFSVVVGCHEKQPQQLLIAVAGCWALGIRNQVHTGGSVTSRDKDKELGWFCG
jgi:hypothetical protein